MSGEALCAVTEIPPLDLLVEKRRKTFNGDRDRDVETWLMEE